jgi:hypothetical protein
MARNVYGLLRTISRVMNQTAILLVTPVAVKSGQCHAHDEISNNDRMAKKKRE